MRHLPRHLVHPLLLLAVLVVPAAALSADPSADAPAPAPAPAELCAAERAEIRSLQERLLAFERTPRLTVDDLGRQTREGYRSLADAARRQREAVREGGRFVAWLSENLQGYQKYLQASTVAAGLIKVLPIPYAGQASLFTRFAAQGVANLEHAGSTIRRYLDAADRYLAIHDGIPAGAVPTADREGELAKRADALLAAEREVKRELAGALEISTSVLSFLEGVKGYLGSAEQYWAKTKALVGRDKGDPPEKGYLAGQIGKLRENALQFTSRLQSFSRQAEADEETMTRVRLFRRLAADLAPREKENGNGS